MQKVHEESQKTKDISHNVKKWGRLKLEIESSDWRQKSFDNVGMASLATSLNGKFHHCI